MKKFAPRYRSNISSMRATVITGNAVTNKIDVRKVIHTNTGNLKNDIPGARRLIIVTMKLKAPAIEEVPSTSKPRT